MKNILEPIFSLSHIGINSENIKEAKSTANLLANMFGFHENEGENSIFVEKSIEVIKSKALGTNGHIAFYTQDIEIAVKYLEKKGIKFNYESAKYNQDNKIVIIYLTQEVGGFAIHLTSKK